MIMIINICIKILKYNSQSKNLPKIYSAILKNSKKLVKN